MIVLSKVATSFASACILIRPKQCCSHRSQIFRQLSLINGLGQSFFVHKKNLLCCENLQQPDHVLIIMRRHIRTRHGIKRSFLHSFSSNLLIKTTLSHFLQYSTSLESLTLLTLDPGGPQHPYFDRHFTAVQHVSRISAPMGGLWPSLPAGAIGRYLLDRPATWLCLSDGPQWRCSIYRFCI